MSRFICRTPSGGRTERALKRALRLVALCLSAATPATAALRLYSYDPADAETRAATGPLTFQFEQTLLGQRVSNIRATDGPAKADLKAADPAALGRGGVSGVVGGAPASAHALYEVLNDENGADLIQALCPGSKRAWIALGKLRADADLAMSVLGDSPGGGAARVCHRLNFTFHGEWRLPAERTISPSPIGPPRRPY
jgi:hypothetical protein